MASGSKDNSVFTGNPTGGTPGDSAGMKRAKIPGGTMISPYPQDNVHGVDLPDVTGCAMAGSDTNLSHSLSGASAVQFQAGAPRSGKNTTKEI